MANERHRRDGTPIWVGDKEYGARRLRRVELRGGGVGAYDEAWLQVLLDNRPEILPIEQIEPGFGSLVSVCRELPLEFGIGRSGALDNVFVTPTGGLVLVEAKLWRNPEARRSVVAQAMEYAAAVFRLSYSEFEDAIKRARQSSRGEERSLYQIVSGHDLAGQERLEESAFIDAISLNLRRGRAIVMVVGDGIREDIMRMVDLLQSHAGHRFTFSLVELAVYEAPEPLSNARLIVPSILAQTVMIERGVVKIEDRASGGPNIVVSDASRPTGGTQKTLSFGISADEFFETLGQREPTWPAILKSFLAKADALGIYPEFQSGLNLKHASPQGNPLNLGTIRKDGFVDTSPSTWWDRTSVGRKYNDTLAALIGGRVQSMTHDTESAVRTAQGKTPRLSDLLPAHESTWLDAIESYVRQINTSTAHSTG